MVNEIKVTYYKEVVQRFKALIMNKFQQNRLMKFLSWAQTSDTNFIRQNSVARALLAIIKKH